MSKAIEGFFFFSLKKFEVLRGIIGQRIYQRIYLYNPEDLFFNLSLFSMATLSPVITV